MSYQPHSVKEILEEINQNYFLPAIQREFVWQPEQIEMLFDSIMSGYPIGTFLLWEVKKTQISEFDFYDFINDYVDKETKNKKSKLKESKEKITAVLDGQQRLTALYIGLMGSFAWKGRGVTQAQPRYLYINLLYKLDENNSEAEYEHEFKFMKEDEASIQSKSKFFFKVSDALNNDFDAIKYSGQHKHFGLNTTIDEESDSLVNAISILNKLKNTFVELKILNSYTEKTDDINKVLEIFVRVNSGGIKLSYSDLLLSMATATWGQENDNNARDEVTAFLKNLKNNQLFNFDKDFIMKSWLYMPSNEELAPNKKSIAPVEFKIKHFKDTMPIIKKEWDGIKNSIEAALILVKKIGYVQEFLPSAYILLPIALHYKLQGEKAFNGPNKDLIAKWISSAILKRVFGGKPDNVLTQIRNVQYEAFNNGIEEFPLKQIAEKLKGSSKDIYSDEGDIENMLEEEYGYRSKLILSQIYILNHAEGYNINSIHQDHIFPQSWFKNEKTMRDKNFSEDQINKFLQSKSYNKLPNLAFMAGIQNKSKSDKDPTEWFDNVKGQSIIKNVGFIPNDIDLNIQNSDQFWASRKNLLRKQLHEKILIMHPTPQTESEAA